MVTSINWYNLVRSNGFHLNVWLQYESFENDTLWFVRIWRNHKNQPKMWGILNYLCTMRIWKWKRFTQFSNPTKALWFQTKLKDILFTVSLIRFINLPEVIVWLDQINDFFFLFSRKKKIFYFYCCGCCWNLWCFKWIPYSLI